MSIFKNALALLSEAQRAIDNFDFDATVDSIVEGSKNAFTGFNDIMKNIKDTISDLKVIVPFNEKKEKYEYSIEDGILKVTVRGKNSLRETSTTIPSNCIIDRLSVFVDKKKGNLIITIPKNLAEDENLKKFKDTVSSKANDTASWIKDALKERAEAVAASTAAPTSKPKAKKNVGKVKPKIVRGKDGKFKAAKKA
jgi:hypothetical protein